MGKRGETEDCVGLPCKIRHNELNEFIYPSTCYIRDNASPSDSRYLKPMACSQDAWVPSAATGQACSGWLDPAQLPTPSPESPDGLSIAIDVSQTIPRRHHVIGKFLVQDQGNRPEERRPRPSADEIITEFHADIRHGTPLPYTPHGPRC